MTPTNLLIVLLLTWSTVTVIDWLVALKSRALVVVICLVVYFVWAIGVPLIVVKG